MRVVAVTVHDRLLEVGVQRRLRARQEARAKQDALRTKRQRRHQTAPVGEAACGENRDGSDRVDHHRDQWHAAHPADVTTSLAALRNDDVGPCRRTTHRFFHRARHIGDLAPRLVSAVEIGLQFLIGSRPGELHHGRLEFEGRGERVLACIEQQEVQSERFVRCLAGCRRALADLLRRQRMTAHRAEPARSRYCGGHRRRRRPSHAAEGDRVVDLQQAADRRPDHATLPANCYARFRREQKCRFDRKDPALRHEVKARSRQRAGHEPDSMVGGGAAPPLRRRSPSIHCRPNNAAMSPP